MWALGWDRNGGRQGRAVGVFTSRASSARWRRGCRLAICAVFVGSGLDGRRHRRWTRVVARNCFQTTSREASDETRSLIDELCVPDAAQDAQARAQAEVDWERLRANNPEECAACASRGWVPCEACGGTGKVTDALQLHRYYCMTCVGRGRVRCPVCGGRCFACRGMDGEEQTGEGSSR